MGRPAMMTAQSVMLTTTVGQGIDLDTYLAKRKSAYDQLQGSQAALPPPFVLLQPTQVEGVDTPFYTRTSDVFPYTAHWRRKWNFFSHLPVQEGIPLLLLAAAPDTTPLFMGRMLDFPFEELRDREKWKRWEAGIQPFTTFPGLMADGVYSDNLCRLMSEIQRHLLEHSIDSGVSWAIWTQAEVKEAIDNRLAKFVGDTGIIRRRDTYVTDANGEFTLNGDVLEVRRVGHSGGVLTRIDELVLNSAYTGWESQTGTPFAYFEYPNESLKLRVFPTPVNGVPLTLSVIVVPVHGELSGCDALPIPAPFVPYVKYGVLADLLAKEGEANDPQRAMYCENRWMEGVELAKALLGTEV